jgi:hypothetical protein
MKIRSTFFYTFFALFVLISPSLGQISFTNSNSLLESSDWHSGVAIGVVDMNNDQIDDILRLEQGEELTIEFQDTATGTFIPFYFGPISGQSQWSMAAGDINNDGKNDVIAGDYNYTKLISAFSDTMDFSFDNLPGPSFFAQAANFADIDNDGFLDIFVCDDNAESRIWHNNGDGSFEMGDDMIDMATDPPSDNSGNYGSIWSDFDNDGDLDLYIAKCRQGVTDPADPRRINALFVNDGENNYTERAADFGLKIGYQSWTADLNDIDNDGDLDCFVTNHDFQNQLLENDGSGHFRDISTGNDIGISTTTFPLQGVMRDFDNDGFVDILVSGSDHHLYHNNGDKTFTEVPNPFDNNDIESYAIGDLNNDGFPDIYAGYANIYTNPSNIEDVIWMNDANDNNWFGLNLIGTESNRNAVGARVEIYGDWGIQIREVRAGESYGIMNSFKQNFGLGQSDAIDYLVVKWPSGIINVIDNPTINEYLTLTESPCGGAPVEVEITAAGNTTICEGGTLNLEAPAGYNYIWSTGETTQTITISEPGAYRLIAQDPATGCYGASQNISIALEVPEIPEVTIDGELEFCAGSSVTLTVSEALSYDWSNGGTGQSIEVTDPGTYFVITEGTCDFYTSESYTVNVLPAPAPVAEDVEVIDAGPATLVASGENPRWYDAETGGNLLAENDTLFLPLVESSLTFWVEDLIEYDEPQSNVGMAEHAGSDYGPTNFSGGIVFDAMEDFTIKSVLVYTDTEAEREIQLRDSNSEVIESLVVNIPATGDEGVRIDLDFVVPVGEDYVLTTNPTVNVGSLGFNSPQLKRSSSSVSYASYEIADLVNLVGPTIGGSNLYYYFFDWEIQPLSIFCESERVPVNVDFVVSATDISQSNVIQLFPNPTDESLQVRFDFNTTTAVELRLIDLTGKQVFFDELSSISAGTTHELNVSELPAGIYLLEVQTGAERYFAKVTVE